MIYQLQHRPFMRGNGCQCCLTGGIHREDGIDGARKRRCLLDGRL